MAVQNVSVWADKDVILPVAGIANKSKPDQALLDKGFDLGQKPAADELNWLLNHYGNVLKALANGIDITKPLGTAAFSDVGTKDINLPTVKTVKDIVSTVSGLPQNYRLITVEGIPAVEITL